MPHTTRIRRATLLALLVLLFAGCDRAPPDTSLVAAPSPTPLPATESPTAPPPSPTFAPPSPTPVPPTAALSPTAARPPPTETPEPTPTPESAAPSAASILAGLDGLPFDRFLEESFRQLQLRDPDTLLYNDLGETYGVEDDGHFTDLSDAYLRETQHLEASLLDLLHGYDRDFLTSGQKLSYDVYEWYLDDLVRGHPFIYHTYAVNGVGTWDTVYSALALLAEVLPVESRQDADNYLRRLSEFDTWIDQLLETLSLRHQAGIVPPRFLLKNAVALVDGSLGAVSTHDLYTSFRTDLNRAEAISPTERADLLDAARAEIQTTVLPSLERLRDYLVDLQASAPEEVGVGRLPNGEAYYAYLLRHHTSTDLTPQEIHEMGKAEVARLQAEIRSVAAQLGYPQDLDLAELDGILAPTGELPEGEALQAEYERLIAVADRAAQDYFLLYPSAPPVVEVDAAAPFAYYQPPPPDGAGPGRMITNLVNPAPYVLYNVPALVHHETIPGHHVQSALAGELDLPLVRSDHIFNVYRQLLPFQAYVEGWALYGEQLACEMGLCEGGPLDYLGQLRLNLHRIARMVVDTGIHALDWSVEEATGYMRQATGRVYGRQQLSQIIAIPGQACGYSAGFLKIQELRQRAMDQLGEQFDIKAFHDIVLGHGSLPLLVLERQVDDWLAAQSAAAASPTGPQEGTPGEAIVSQIIAGLQGLPIDEFFEASYRQLLLRDPDALFEAGLADPYGVPNDRFSDRSDAYLRETQRLESAILDLLRGYDREILSPEQQLSYELYEYYLDDRVQGHPFLYYNYPINPMTVWGQHNWLVDFMVSRQRIRDLQDAEDYVARLSEIGTWMDDLLEGLRLRQEAGVVAPRYLLDGAITQVEGHLRIDGYGTPQPEAIELYTSFRERLQVSSAIHPDQQAALLEAALAEIKNTFVPAFLRLRDELVALSAVAGKRSGVNRLPDGEAYYAHALRHETTTEMTAAEIHDLGRSEVVRIQAEMRQVAADRLGYPPDLTMADLEAHLAAQEGSDGFLSGKALLARAEALIAEANQATEGFFDLRPRAEVIVEQEPFGSGMAYYRAPPLDGSGPGVFYLNLELPLPRYLLPTVAYHEAVPGHHLQNALAQELELPTFRRAIGFNAYVEGWAMYGEQLAAEMGLYNDDPLGDLGRLGFELRRAARMVVDTGIHALGWTRAEAAAYYEEATGAPTPSAAMDRFVILPGQGCGYTLGLLKIRDLRQQAANRLGEAFDIKAFHNTVLGSGDVPLPLLERIVEDWIEAELESG